MPMLSYWNGESESDERENKEGFGEDHGARSYSKVFGKCRESEKTTMVTRGGEKTPAFIRQTPCVIITAVHSK